MSAEEWDGLGWDLQRVYLEGMQQDESVPMHERVPEDDLSATGAGPVVRENVDAGVDVIDLSKLRAELDRAREVARGL